MTLKGKSLADALKAEITNRDNVHDQLELIDMIVHELLNMTKPKRTADEDCGCNK